MLFMPPVEFVLFFSSQPSTNTSQSPSLHRSAMAATEAKPSPAAASSSEGASLGGRARPEPEEASSQLDELRSQMKELLLSVELLKAQQM